MSPEPLSVLSMAEPKAPMKKQVRAALILTWMGASVLLGLWTATQRVAHALAYHPELKGVLVRGTDAALYVPWAYLSWNKTLKDQIPQALERGQIGLLAGGLCFVVGMRLLRAKKPRESIAHGSSRWARTAELPDMKLVLPDGKERWDGVVLGKTREQVLLTHDGPEHVLVFAPTRSGKGVGLVVPTLLTWPSSVVVLDIKGENWELTAGHRARRSHAFRFDPTSEDSVRFNPLDEIRIRTKDEIRDMQNLTKILCDPDGTGNATDHWSQSASMLLTGVILHVLYNEPDKTLSGVLSFLRDPGRSSEDMYNLMKQSPHASIAQAGASMLNKADKERAGILSTAEKFLGLYEDPLVKNATSKSDFKIEHLMDGAHPVSLYLVVPPNDMLRLRPLLRLMFTMMLGKLTESRTHKQRLLFLLDEFPTLGKMDVLEAALAFVAGYGMKIMLIAQSLSQFEGAYGPNNSVLDNCHVQVTFASGDDKTSKRVSEMLGQGTWFKKQEGESGKKGIFGLDNMSRSEVEYARPLLTPAEIKQLDETRGILMVAGRPPLLFHKVRYYQEPRWKPRLLAPPDQNKDLPARCRKCHALLMQHITPVSVVAAKEPLKPKQQAPQLYVPPKQDEQLPASQVRELALAAPKHPAAHDAGAALVQQEPVAVQQEPAALPHHPSDVAPEPHMFPDFSGSALATQAPILAQEICEEPMPSSEFQELDAQEQPAGSIHPSAELVRVELELFDGPQDEGMDGGEQEEQQPLNVELEQQEPQPLNVELEEFDLFPDVLSQDIQEAGVEHVQENERGDEVSQREPARRFEVIVEHEDIII